MAPMSKSNAKLVGAGAVAARHKLMPREVWVWRKGCRSHAEEAGWQDDV